ncbi:MAG: Rieske 2Fe-2S domain-containing protein [Candidatus Nanopelagicales bacterium]
MTLVALGSPAGRTAWTVTDGVRRFAVHVVDGTVYVTDAACPHRGGPLAEGRVRDGAIVCPWHWYAYDLGDGRCRTTDDLTLRTYPVLEVDGELVTDVGEPPPIRTWADILRAHAVGP